MPVAPFTPPLFTFRFHVAFERVTLDGGGGSRAPAAQPLADGAFSEISGLEATLEPKAIKEGGVNYGAHQRPGAVTFGTVVLKRGITRSRDLWQWWALVAGAGSGQRAANGAWAQRLQVTITLLDADGSPALAWRLERALPVKFKVADFNARGTEVGIEEMHLVHEGLVAAEPATTAGAARGAAAAAAGGAR